MHFLLYTMVGPRSSSALGKKPFFKMPQAKIREKKNLELKNCKLSKELKNQEGKASFL